MPAISSVANGREPSVLTEELMSRLSIYQQMDAERNNVIQAMFHKLSQSEERIRELELDLDDQKRARANYQSEARDLQREKQLRDSRLNNGSFVVVLIDGDGAKFRDEFLRDHEQGAAKAAWKLKEAVKNAGFSNDVPILVRVYANINDLGRSLRLSGVIDFDDNLRVFAEQFTNTYADCDFINVGKGKENTDSKIRRLLDHYYKNAQCRAIFIACCHDNGYLHDLRQYAGGDLDARIHLIETTPAEPAFRTLQYPILRFDSVFRSEPLNNETKRGIQNFPVKAHSPPQQLLPRPIARPVQAPLNPLEPLSPEPQEQRWPTPSTISAAASPVQALNTLATPANDRFQLLPPQPDKSPIQSQAYTRSSNVISSGNGGTSISYATAGGTADHQNVTVKLAKSKKQLKYAYYNQDKFRLDPPTQHPPRTPAQGTYQNKFQTIKPLVFCNDHYLKGRCKRGVNCDKEHEVELTAAEVAIHRYKARTSLCPQGPLCTDHDCYLSHHCPRSPCTRGDMCPFYDTANWGDLHYTKEQLLPATKWAEGDEFPEYLDR
ncbi:putative C-x8-C-x5-C-x3-H type zinc finger protein [Rosellinia necatrix]|uniref:Putative C-x8-C-x5-C-x3-H type zinc finger protein n=1 Tax=Rosellinia necatrix TaxID=77044 RepID=A0A1W2TJB7_ROSNE|nr:putative C-x8-C-x5-C-x3-H type zinc finger protein [Rosellinia necatrix]